MVSVRIVRGLASPLPLAGEADALEERGGWGLSPRRESQCGSTPTPALPRKRERERSADAVAARASYAIARDKPGHDEFDGIQCWSKHVDGRDKPGHDEGWGGGPLFCRRRLPLP